MVVVGIMVLLCYCVGKYYTHKWWSTCTSPVLLPGSVLHRVSHTHSPCIPCHPTNCKDDAHGMLAKLTDIHNQSVLLFAAHRATVIAQGDAVACSGFLV